MVAMTDAHTDDASRPQTLGAYLRTAREDAGFTQQQVAGRLGVTRQAVSAWESDETIPGPRALSFLAREIPGITAAELLARIPSGTR